jgi:hypothetical protein
MRTIFVILILFCDTGIVRGQEISGINVICPTEWNGQIKDSTLFLSDFYGVFYKDDGKSLIRSFRGADSIVVTPSLGYHRRIFADSLMPDFIFSGFSIANNFQIPGLHLQDRMIISGDSIKIEIGNRCYTLFSISDRKKHDEDSSKTSRLIGYTLVLRLDIDENSFVQKLYQIDLNYWGYDQLEGGIHLKWIGDLNNDLCLDILLSKSCDYRMKEIIFLLGCADDQLVKEVSNYVFSGDQ